MKKSYFVSIILAVALVIISAHLAVMKNEGNASTANARDSIINNIMTRTSVRAYKDMLVAKVDIETLLKAGMAAPTAQNKQPWHFIVITDKNILKAIGEAMPNAAEAATAPLAITVCGDMSKAIVGEGREEWVQDASAATENILLAAHAMGLGAVWTGAYPVKERTAKLAKVLRLPQGIVPLNTILIGYPAQKNTSKDKWKIDNISYNVYGNADNGSVAETKLKMEEKEFRNFDVDNEFKENGFTFFEGNGHGLLLAAGDKAKSNAMTIGWGGIGTLWGNNNAITVYVAQSRYTLQFMNKAKYFTIMSFDSEHANVLDYMGSHSGRDGNKAKKLGLHTLYTEHDTPYYAEAQMVIECEMMYAAPFTQVGFKEIPHDLYSNFPAGVHSVFIGRVVNAMKK